LELKEDQRGQQSIFQNNRKGVIIIKLQQHWCQQLPLSISNNLAVDENNFTI